MSLISSVPNNRISPLLQPYQLIYSSKWHVIRGEINNQYQLIMISIECCDLRCLERIRFSRARRLRPSSIKSWVISSSPGRKYSIQVRQEIMIQGSVWNIQIIQNWLYTMHKPQRVSIRRYLWTDESPRNANISIRDWSKWRSKTTKSRSGSRCWIPRRWTELTEGDLWQKKEKTRRFYLVSTWAMQQKPFWREGKWVQNFRVKAVAWFVRQKIHLQTQKSFTHP